MKIQCSCGAKYEFEVTPEMAREPVRFVCQQCGLDSSDFVNDLIRREFATESPKAASPVKVPIEMPRLKIAGAEPPSPPPTSEESKYCPRHHGVLTTNRCAVCQKPICPKCMELFGYVCSAFCKAKAETQNIAVPRYAGQKMNVEARFWRRTRAIFSTAFVVIIAAVGFWIWYAWFGSVPGPVFSLRFDEPAYAGESRLCGNDQIVFLHGGTLARYDLKSKNKIWSDELITKQQIADEVARENELNKNLERPMPQSKLTQMVETEMTSSLHLRVSGQSVWVSAPGELTRYDWDTGKVAQEIPLLGESENFVSQGGELLALNQNKAGQEAILHINLASGETREEKIGVTSSPGGTVATSAGAGGTATAGLPIGTPGADQNRPMNPAKVAQQAQDLSLPARIALPALLANDAHNEQIQKELNDTDQSRPRHQTVAQSGPAAANVRRAENFTLVSGKYDDALFSVRLLEQKIVTREAMKAPPEKSALNNPNLSAANETEAVNEQLNEMQRNRGGDTVSEDESRYQVTVHLPDSNVADWSGEVVGPPQLLLLKTVNVVAAGKTIIVLDKADKKLWQTTLTYNVSPDASGLNGQGAPFGAGPCVERGDTLYVFDQAVLTAFDLKTGGARWRLPSVGVVGLFFDDKGMLYVNTTTASPENIKYSRQIDVTQKIDAILLKVDPRTGRILWTAKPGGFISYLSGKFIYTVQWYQPTDEELKTAEIAGITPRPPYLRIKRISPSDGHVLWEHYQERAPLDVRFNNNLIEVVFRKEVEVLKFFSL
jgi:PQQ-like domain